VTERATDSLGFLRGSSFLLRFTTRQVLSIVDAQLSIQIIKKSLAYKLTENSYFVINGLLPGSDRIDNACIYINRPSASHKT
jgi:hypothetical protein